MGPFSQNYEPLKETLLEKEDLPLGAHCQKCRSRLLTIRLLSVAVAIWIVLCSLLLYRQFGTSSRLEPIRSEYGTFLQFITEKKRFIGLTAGLTRDILVPLTRIGHENTTPEEEWEAQIEGNGVLALTDEYTSSMKLPTAQRWPWSSSKGIYVLQGHHNLHCLVFRHKFPHSLH